MCKKVVIPSPPRQMKDLLFAGGKLRRGANSRSLDCTAKAVPLEMTIF